MVFNVALLRSALDLPYDVFVDNILPRVFGSSDGGVEGPVQLSREKMPLTPRAVIDEVLSAIYACYGDKDDYEARVRDLYASLLHHFCDQLVRDLRVTPLPAGTERLVLGDCEQLCGSLGPSCYPTLRWTSPGCRGPGRHVMATTLLACQTGRRVVLSVNELRIWGNSLKIYLQSVEGEAGVKGVVSSEQAAVASLAVVARRGGSRGGTSFGELVLGRKGYLYQEARDALEASRFTMSEIKSLSSTTLVRYENGGGVLVEFPNIMESLSGLGDAGEELLLTVGACFVGLDLVHHMAYYPVRLVVLEEMVHARRASGHEGVFSRLNRLDCDMNVLATWEKRMFV